MPTATFAAWLALLVFLFFPPQTPPSAPSAQLAFPFYCEEVRPLDAFALDYGT